MRLLIRLIGLVVIVAIVAGVSLLLLPSDRIASIAAEQISKQTGREVVLEGETKITLWPILGVSTEKFVVANASWSDGGPMLSAENLKIGVEPQALWGGEVRVTGLEATAPTILLERASDGRVNWQLGVEGVAPSGQSDAGQPATSGRLALTLDRALIEHASLTYKDHGAGQTIEISGIDLELRWPDYAGTATFDASLDPIGGAGRDLADSNRIQVTGHLDQVGAFIDGALTTLETRVEAPGGSFNFVGRASTAPQAEGRLDAQLTDTKSFLSAFGVTGVEIPPGMGQSVSLTTLLTVSDALRIALRDSTLQLDNNTMTGGADIDLSGAKPRLAAQLRAGALDFSSFAGSDSNNSGSDGGANSASTGWSKAPIDASALGLVDGDFALVADSIDLGDLTLGKTRTKAALTRSRLVFTIAELLLYDGELSGEFVINNRSGLSVGGNLRASGLNIKTLLTDAMGISRLTGTAAGQVQFLGVGQSMNAIMNALSGSGQVETGRGVIEGIDLDRLMRAGDLTGGTTVFDRLSASFTMDKGQLYNNDLLLSLPLASADGEGRVGLGTRDIDYLFTPKLLSGENRQGLAIPVSIKGPWSNPRIVPDLEKAIDLNLKEERDKLKTQVRDEVNEAIQKELGVQVEEGQSLEDAIEDTLKKELGDGLLKLFD